MRATSRATRKAALILFSVAVLLAGVAAAVRGQSALDGFDPNVNGAVRVVVVQPDGKTLIGGEFTTVLGVSRNHIARLNPDGTLDAAFDPNANNFVLIIAVQADGKILAGGTFTGANSIGGQTRNNIARLDPTTGLADSWDPNANGFVQGIAVQADGKILTGGAFTSIGGQMRNHVARLDALTGLADSWDPNANIAVRSIAVQADGKILACGDFNGANSIGGQTRNRIARLDATTGLADSWDPNANSFVRTIAVQADGKIVAGGDFNGANSIGGATRNFIARLDPTTGLADSFDPNANSFVRSVAVQADGKILAGGDFSGANSIGGQTRNFIARLDATTGLADSFDPNANSFVRSVAVQADGKILVGGFFTTLAPNGGAAVTRNSIARLGTDGRLDQTLDLGAVGSSVSATALQPDGKILIGGGFTTVLGVARSNIARLNTDGTLDTTFNPNSNGGVFA
ncbi:MAG TPA: delta-60 repeat domain-containing protein, partial [Chthoniobacterales bacterium]|nr:delta-60 repeat domain-containing protein [Chthoniobacterales bacterium]